MRLPFVLFCLAASAVHLAAIDAAKIDKTVQQALESTGVPSASIALVQNGEIVYTHAYGKGELQPAREAQPSMRYAVGSISKQFTATAMLLLVEQHKLSLDDTVSKYFPGLTRSREVTIRMLLSHTSGYSDYWPQDYVMPTMLQPVTASAIVDRWAKQPLDFDPGTKWQYSNTGYVLAGQIIEQVVQRPLFKFLEERIFTKLGMKTVFDVDRAPLPASDAVGYYRHALGPLRRAPKEGAGWLSAAGELSMTAEDLARWNISVLKQTVLKPESYREMFTEVKNRYGLGVFVSERNRHTYVTHDGEVSGFVAFNEIVVDAGTAVTVLTNQDAVGTASTVGHALSPMLLSAPDLERVKQIYSGLRHGQVDRSLFTDSCNAYFSNEALQDFKSSLEPLGEPENFTLTVSSKRGGMTFNAYRVKLRSRELQVTTYTTHEPENKIEQYLVSPVE